MSRFIRKKADKGGFFMKRTANKRLPRKVVILDAGESPETTTETTAADVEAKVAEPTVDNSKNNDTEMKEDALDQIKDILEDSENENATAPKKRKVKVEKKEKGIIERMESSTILLTEDNKMLLND